MHAWINRPISDDLMWLELVSRVTRFQRDEQTHPFLRMSKAVHTLQYNCVDKLSLYHQIILHAASESNLRFGVDPKFNRLCKVI